MLNRLCSAAALLVLTTAFGLAASDAHAQTTINASSPFSGTFGSSHIDTNGDGQTAGTQTVSLSGGPLGRSTVEGLDEFVVTGEGPCQNGNPGIMFALLIAPTAPAALVQRFEQTGDLLYLIETDSSACFDAATGILFFQNAGVITGGTGRLAGATGTFSFGGTGTFLFSDGISVFGPQSGTFVQTIVTRN